MRYFTPEEVMARIEEKSKTKKPKTVFEVDFKRLQREKRKSDSRSDACIDALILDLNRTKEALSYVQFENKVYRRRCIKQKKIIEELGARLAVGEK